MSRPSAYFIDRLFMAPAASRASGPFVPQPPPHVAGIRFALSRPSPTLVRVLDARGREVRVLVAAELDPGEHRCAWDGYDSSGSSVPAGEYTLQLEVNGDLLTARRVLVG